MENKPNYLAASSGSKDLESLALSCMISDQVLMLTVQNFTWALRYHSNSETSPCFALAVKVPPRPHGVGKAHSQTLLCYLWQGLIQTLPIPILCFLNDWLNCLFPLVNRNKMLVKHTLAKLLSFPSPWTTFPEVGRLLYKHSDLWSDPPPFIPRSHSCFFLACLFLPV